MTYNQSEDGGNEQDETEFITSEDDSPVQDCRDDDVSILGPAFGLNLATQDDANSIQTVTLSCKLTRGHRSSVQCGPHIITLEGCGYRMLCNIALVTLVVTDTRTGLRVEVEEEVTSNQMEDPESRFWQVYANLPVRVLSCNGQDEAVVQYKDQSQP